MRGGLFQMRLALLVAILLVDAAALQPLAAQRITPVRATRACVRMGWAEAKKKREEEDRIKFAEMQARHRSDRPCHHHPYHGHLPQRRHQHQHPRPHRHPRQELRARESVKREAAVKVEREQAEEKRRKELARVQEFQDNVDFDRPGGVLRGAPRALTKRDLENAQVMSSPVIDAEAKLQDATAKAGTLDSQDSAISLLREVLATADAARVPAQSPQRKAAAALLSAFEQAVTQAESATPVDPQQAEMSCLYP